MINSIYKKHLLELYAEKPNFGQLAKDKVTHTISQKNLVCNDELIIQLEVKDNKIFDAKFHGVSCFISIVSASVLLEHIKGMTLKQAQKLTKADMDKFLGIDVIPTRINCELMPLEALKKLNIDK
jgi:NifU-like protein involved in Fe-S cluster formation